MSLPFIPDLLRRTECPVLGSTLAHARAMSRHMASFAPLLSIGRLATIRRKPRVPIADDRSDALVTSG
ncbi:hypothetical protein RN69_18180 [Bradyrhizobium japonicum]|nr:hypothetical protein RN69_18180 [Bradyrhizobium japonicum]